MRCKRSLLAFVSILLCLSVISDAQNWSGVISPSRAADWSSAGVVGGIPSGTWSNCVTTACNTLNGGTVTSASISAAISSAPANTVVRIPAGSFSVTSGISFGGKSNVVLRGAGADQTLLTVTGTSSPCITPSGAAVSMCGTSTANVGQAGTVHNWTGTTEGGAGVYPKGASHLIFDSVSGWSVDTLIVLDQIDDATDTGNVLVNQTTTYSQEGGSPGRSGPRSQQQFVRITAINGTTVTITPGIYMPNWRTSQTPQAWTLGVVGATVATMEGLEDLLINTAGAASGGTGLSLMNCYQCWVKGVASLRDAVQRNHMWLYQGVHEEIRDCYFYGSNGTSSSYGTETFMGSDNLIINNIFQHVTVPLMTGNNTGSVFAYNFSVDDNYLGASGNWSFEQMATHDAGVSYLLYEGNEGAGVIVDDIHGTENFVTMFRSQLTGRDYGGPTKTQSTIPLENQAYSRYQNVIGNVLGTSGYHTKYQATGGDGDTSIYTLGWQGNSGTGTFDSLVGSTIMRWGNWDVVTSTNDNGTNDSTGTRFVSGEVPTAAPLYPNSVPANQTLPASFFLSSKPSWWPSATAWPPIGPDVANGNIANFGGHGYSIPARDCYVTVMGGSLTTSVGPLAFNASNCYVTLSGGTPPAPPTNLGAIVK